MAHDVHGPSSCGDHSYEITFQLEDGRHEARDAGSRTWPSSRRDASSLDSPFGLARFRISAKLFWQAQSCLRGKKKPPPKTEVGV